MDLYTTRNHALLSQEQRSRTLRTVCPRVVPRYLLPLCHPNPHPQENTYLGEGSALRFLLWCSLGGYVLLRTLRIDPYTDDADAGDGNDWAGGKGIPFRLSQLGNSKIECGMDIATDGDAYPLDHPSYILLSDAPTTHPAEDESDILQSL